MTYELIDVTCLGDTCVRHAVGREYAPYPYQQAVVDSIRALDVTTIKMRRCADDFRRLIRRRPRGKQARRAAFYARQRTLRKAR